MISISAKLVLLCFLVPVIVHANACAQALPARASSTGFQLPVVAGSLAYSATASTTATAGFNGGDRSTSSGSLSANLAYIGDSVKRPFSMLYSGGYLAGIGQPSGLFQNLALSQVLTFRKLSVSLADSVRYTPATPTEGLSGVAGLGDAGVTPVNVGGDPGQTALTQYTTRIANAASGTLEFKVSPATSVSVTLDDFILRYTGDQGGLATDSLSEVAAVSHRVDARTNVGGSYIHRRFSYPGYTDTIATNGVNFDFHRDLSRTLQIDASLGPERTSGEQVSSSLDLAADVSVRYTGRRQTLVGSYLQGSNSGSGVAGGSHLNTVQLKASRQLSLTLWGSIFIGDSRNVGLQEVNTPSLRVNSLIAGLQVARSLGRVLSAYGSYSAQRQSIASTGDISPILLSGLVQTFGFGLSYAPPALRLGRE